MKECAKRHQPLSPNQYSRTYPPTLFVKEKAASVFKKPELEAAMRRMLETGKIRVETWGPPSKRHEYVILAE